MNTIRSCFTATVAFLVVAIGGKVASSMDNVVPARKCCAMDQIYDQKSRFCSRPTGHGSKFEPSRLNVTVAANTVLDMFYDERLHCNATEVLVDVPAVEVRGLMEAHTSPIELPPGYCFDLTPSDELVARTCRPRDQYCGRGNYTCVKKCCDPGFILVSLPDSDDFWCTKSEIPFTVSAYESDAGGSPVGRSNNTVLPYDTHLCGFVNLMDDRFMLTTDGSLFLIHEGVEWIIPGTDYCLEYYIEDGPPEAADLRAFLCTNAKPPVSILFWVKILSVVCLVLTLIVYATLPYLRNASGYYFMFYMACQLVYFVFDVIYDLVEDDINSPWCIPYGYFAFFATMTTCCWLNVICFDVYWMLRYNNSINRNTSISVRTIMYHIYCWGFPSICVSTGFLFQYSQNEKLLTIAPDIGIYKCFFSDLDDYGNLIFYWLPTCGMLTANLILFFLTAIHFSRIKSELNKFRRTDSKIEMFLVYKERFVMHIKLFLVFGMPFSFFMVSQFFQFKGIKAVIIKAITNLQGVYIFIIFVTKSKVIMNLRKKFRGSIDYSEGRRINTFSRSS
ncbi:probable G-protein coupled receptor Mth-like 6 isoform X2 [Metopolophium dirhodum]|uniref:probable G-protein coupled receptor Mth-like 6 isoform X2 n=1 Tax=Metopolophium dirhodum TaxID=44670 RepID=UPI00299062AF|nr:probable G-protein coupled receptor Mth-like 6 isoform X2 [Metopolophium dirhodum]